MSDIDNLRESIESRVKDKITVEELAIEVQRLKEITIEILNKLKTRTF